MDDKRFAVLIDADNISAKYLPAILDEMTKYGISTYRRSYGDWTSPHATKWKLVLLENSITPIQQFANTTGKNATDSTLIIDAMDILYTRSVDGFCIVSSDGDFTRLASRLREDGMIVIGMGEEKTPRSFRSACSIFTTLENLIDTEEPEPEKKSTRSKKKVSQNIERSSIESAIAEIIAENENSGRITGLGEIGSRLVNKYPDFDVRNYGYSFLSKFLEESSSFEIRKKDSTITVFLKDSQMDRDKIVAFISQTVKEQQDIGVNELSNQVHEKFDNFNQKDFGYSQFSKFIQGLSGITVYVGTDKRKHAKWTDD
ncbi:MAG: NYN domain-containing protein [Hespellia sp.]|nr:NYN domain-containing protein [Hespellia sp.]